MYSSFLPRGSKRAKLTAQPADFRHAIAWLSPATSVKLNSRQRVPSADLNDERARNSPPLASLTAPVGMLPSEAARPGAAIVPISSPPPAADGECPAR